MFLILMVLMVLQGYDLHFIIGYIHEAGIKPEIIANGQKIMSLTTQGIQFIDSLNYFGTALAKLPSIFGLTELQKGFFPHLFSIPENQEYKGAMPDAKYYDPEGMREAKKKEFDEWYNKQTYFDYQADILKYCISDVDILRQSCGRFRSLFRDHTEGMDPFGGCFTIASACNKVYRTLFLQEEQIAIIPPHGYPNDVQSSIALCWMDWVTSREGPIIQHAYHGRERYVEGEKVDGVDKNGIIYEFHG